jgi:flagellin
MMIQNSTRLALIGQIGKTNQGLAKILERLATGRSINRASDDAAGLAVSEQLMTQVRGFRQATNNVDYATAAMQIGEGAGVEISDMLQRQRELAVQASNDTLTDPQRAALNTEYQQLTQEIDRTAQASQFNRQGTAAGTGIASGTAQVLVGPNPGNEVTLPAADFTAANLNIAPTGIATAADARNAIAALDAAMGTVNTQRSNLGAMVNRMEHTRNNLQNQEINTQAAESVIRDLDFAVGIADFVRQNLLSQSATRTLRNFNQVSSQNLLSLLGG